MIRRHSGLFARPSHSADVQGLIPGRRLPVWNLHIEPKQQGKNEDASSSLKVFQPRLESLFWRKNKDELGIKRELI